jgi:hypothetical protein
VSIMTCMCGYRLTTAAFHQQLLTLPVESVSQIKDELDEDFAGKSVSAHRQYKVVWKEDGVK